MKNNFKKYGIIIMGLVLFLCLPACQKSEAAPLVDPNQNSFDELLEEAKSDNENKLNAVDISKIEHFDYVTTINNAKGDVVTKVNANIEIPSTDKFAVYSVKQLPFSQEFTDKVIAKVFGGKKLYNGDAIDAMSDINGYLKDIEETGSNALKAVYQEYLDALINGFDLKSEKVSLEDFPSDGKLKCPKTLYENNTYYKWHKDMYGDGDYLLAITDGKDGQFTTLRIYNSAEKSNRLEVIQNTLGQKTSVNTDYLSQEDFEKHFGSIDEIVKSTSNKAEPENYYTNTSTLNKDPVSYVPAPNESCTLPLEEAISKADAFLKDLGIDSFKCYDTVKENQEIFFVAGKEIKVYRPVYKLTYYRDINGVLLTQSSGDKHNLMSNPEEAHYTKKYWRAEVITIRINDNGIVHFIYDSPLEIKETVADNVSVKTFDEVKSYFENVMAATKTQYEGFSYEYNIEKVRLSYSRVSEDNSNYMDGLIVPMWDFYGTLVRKDPSGITTVKGQSFIAVNAIDGTIIKPSNGLY